MRFVGESFGLGWSVKGSNSLSIRCSHHHASSHLVPLEASRASDMARLQKVHLTLQIHRGEEGGPTFNDIAHQWKRLGLGEFEQPGLYPATWLTYWGDELAMETYVPEMAFDQLVERFASFGAAHGPKFFWGQAFDFRFDVSTEFREASSDQVQAFFSKGLPVFSRKAPFINFVVGHSSDYLGDLE